MKTKISRIGKKSLSVIIALMMIVSTMLVGMVSVNAANDPTKAEFYLVGQFTGSNWNSDKTKYKIENNYSGSNVIFYYDVEGTDLNGKWFAICNSSGSRYAPSTSEAIGIGQSNKKSGTYNESNSWQYTGSATKIRICVDQRDSTSDNMYYPYVWVEEISESTKYTVSKGTETNGTFSVSPTSAAEGDTVTVTTSPSNGYEVDTVTYTYGTTTADATASETNKYTFTMPAANVTVNVSFKATSTPSTTYYLTGTSTAVTVTATKVAQVHDFTVYFKCASAPAYKPYVSLDGATAVAMTQGTELGKNYAGTLTFYWYSYTFNVDSADTHNLTFTSKKTKLNATITDNFANSEYYLAVDNLMTGTEVVDLTGSLEYVRNFFHSATNMVYSGVGTDGTLGFTNIDGERYKMGTVVNTDGTLTFSVKSATTMQMLTAELTTVSDTQKALLDVDLDGKVDIKDATLMQRALVS